MHTQTNQMNFESIAQDTAQLSFLAIVATGFIASIIGLM